MVVLDVDVLVDNALLRLWVTVVDQTFIGLSPGVEVWCWLIEGESDLEISGHDASGHVVDTPFWNGPVDNGDREILRLGLVHGWFCIARSERITYGSPIAHSSAEDCVTWHAHIKTCKGIRNTTMLCLPVTHDEALEAELRLQNTVQELGVLAAVGVVKLVVGAHERSDSSADCVGKWPRVELVKSAVVQVGGGRLGDVVAVTDCLWSLTEVLLLVGKPVL